MGLFDIFKKKERKNTTECKNNECHSLLLDRNELNILHSFSIIHKGCIGFLIGDNKEFVFSRIVHLNLMSEEEAHDYDMNVKMGMTITNDCISVARGLFENFESISFKFKNDILVSIQIYLNEKNTNVELFNEIKTAISRGEAGQPMNISGTTAIWQKSSLYFSIYIDGMMRFIRIADKRLE